MIVLGIDTAGPVVGAALVRSGPAGGVTTGCWSARVVRGAGAALAPALAELLAGAHPDAIAISVGPGAFTSLRVGVASALGIALSRGLPVVPVSALTARAAGVAASGARVLALLDARKGRAYAAFYVGGERLGDEVDAPPAQAVALASGTFVATGEGAVVFRAQIEAAGGRVHPLATESPAAQVARLGLAGIDSAVPPEAVRLNYIRPSDARLPSER